MVRDVEMDQVAIVIISSTTVQDQKPETALGCHYAGPSYIGSHVTVTPFEEDQWIFRVSMLQVVNYWY